MFLTAKELEELTGYIRQSAQRRWLLENGYSFDIRGDGRPALMTDQVRERQLLKGQNKSRPKKSWEPDWDAFDARLSS